MKSLIIFIVILSNTLTLFSKDTFITTIQPVYAIVSELVPPEIKVECLLAPGASPHTYSLKPSDMKKVSNAKALFFVSEENDGWASDLPVTNKIELMELLPQKFKLRYSDIDNSGSDDPTFDTHFWTDPLAVKALIPYLRDKLIIMDRKNAVIYKQKAKDFENKLDQLNSQIEVILKNVKGQPVVQHHQSFNYFIKRYKLKWAGTIFISPGREPSPKFMNKLIHDLKANNAKAIFAEVQFPESTAKTIASSTGAKIFTVDPLGGVNGRKSYTELLLYNAEIFKKALSY